MSLTVRPLITSIKLFFLTLVNLRLANDLHREYRGDGRSCRDVMPCAAGPSRWGRGRVDPASVEETWDPLGQRSIG
jgi:hypothetical protein